MGAAGNETHSMWLRVSGHCLKSVSLIAIITSLQVSCVGHETVQGRHRSAVEFSHKPRTLTELNFCYYGI